MSGTCARVRLRFEQPAPLVCGSGPGAWLLVDMESCRLVADLEFLIKRRFGLSKRRRLHLWLDGFLLPPTEKIAVVRDGDVISVEQTEEPTSEDCTISPTSSNQGTTSETGLKKRKAQTSEEDVPDTAKLRIHNKDGKRKKQKLHVNGSDSGVSTSSSAVPVPSKVADTKTKEVQKAQTKKKEKKSTKNPGKPSKVAAIAPKASGMGNKRDISKPATSKGSAINGGKPNSTKVVKPVATKSRGKVKNSSSSSSSEDTSSNSEDTDSDSSSSDSSSSDTSKEVKPRSSANTKTCSRPGLVTNPQQRKKKPNTDTSSSDSSSSDTDTDVRINKQTQSKQVAVGIPAQRQLQSNPQQNGRMMFSCNAGKVSSVGGTVSQAHTSVPTASPLLQARDTRHVSVLSLTVPISQRPQAVTAGKQQAASSSHNYKGKATGPPSKGHIVFDSDSESDSDNGGTGGKMEDLQPHAPDRVVTSHIDVPQTNTTQAPHQAIHERRKSPGLEEAPSPVPPPVPKDYAAFPPLHGPPRVGDRIAYKILEMSANYCPEISSYKEAVVTGYDLSTGDMQLDMVYDITAYMKENQPGRFEMEVDLGDQVDKTDNKVTVAVSALVEPRLVQD